MAVQTFLRRVTADTLSLSFLDVISCAMGAGFLLFFALSVVRTSQSPQMPSVGTPTIVVLLETDAPPTARFKIGVKAPGGSWVWITSDDASRRGLCDNTQAMRRLSGGCYELYGAAFDHKERMVAALPGEPAMEQQALVLRLSRMVPGCWEFGVILWNSADDATHKNDTVTNGEYQLTAWIHAPAYSAAIATTVQLGVIRILERPIDSQTETNATCLRASGVPVAASTD